MVHQVMLELQEHHLLQVQAVPRDHLAQTVQQEFLEVHSHLVLLVLVVHQVQAVQQVTQVYQAHQVLVVLLDLTEQLELLVLLILLELPAQPVLMEQQVPLEVQQLQVQAVHQALQVLLV